MPETDTEKLVAGVWSHLLGVDKIGRDDNFFELGGHSLLAVKAVAELENATGIRVELRHIIMENLLRVARKLDRQHSRAAPKSGLKSVLRAVSGRIGAIGRGLQ